MPPNSIKGPDFFSKVSFHSMESKREQVKAEILKLWRKREKLALDIPVETNNNVKKSKITLRKELKKEIKWLIKSLPGFTGHNRWMVVEPEWSSDSD